MCSNGENPGTFFIIFITSSALLYRCWNTVRCEVMQSQKFCNMGITERSPGCSYYIVHSVLCLSAPFSCHKISILLLGTHKPWRRSAILMAIMLNITAFNGCTSIITYASSIMLSSGITMNPELQTLSFPVIMILAAFVSMACVERFGRKVSLKHYFKSTYLVWVLNRETTSTVYISIIIYP